MAPNNSEELRLLDSGYKNIVACDECGCGSLMGFVQTACVILPPDVIYKHKTYLPHLNDSKKLTAEQRTTLSKLIKGCCVEFQFGEASVAEIDQLNIYWAKFLAFRRAIEKLEHRPDYILIDGDKKIPEIAQDNQKAIVKGDGISISIAAASIIAKVERDQQVCDLVDANPELAVYEWKQNKGYYTDAHIAALKKYGKTIYHREKYVKKFL